MKNTIFIFSIIKRGLGVFLLILSYLCYGLMASLAADQDLTSYERVVYPLLVYAVSWVFFLGGIYLAGPEVIDKIKEFFISLKSKFKKNDK